MGYDVPPLEESRYLPEFPPERVHLLLQGVYRDLLRHNNRLHVDGGVLDNSVWQSCCLWLDAQSASWYATPAGAVGHRFMSILAVEWQGVLDRSWNSKTPLVFAHIILMKTLIICRSR